MLHLWCFILLSLTSLFSASAQVQADQYTFASTYEQWVDPNNHFIDYFEVGGIQQARVVFIGSQSFADTGGNRPSPNRPTVSEGMGYGLLLAYAHDDQITFDKFLNYILPITNSSGCCIFSGEQQACLQQCPFLMPWVINNQGSPYWYKPNPTGTAYFSSGSASDADFQIAWAIWLASKKVSEGTWASTIFPTVKGSLTYRQIFEEMAKEIRLSDVIAQTNPPINLALLYTPGNQWGNKKGQTGTTVMYPGYYTPQAFIALADASLIDISDACPSKFPIQTPNNSLKLVFKNNNTQAVSIDYLASGDPNVEIAVDSNFIPKPGNPTGYTVDALVEATATISSSNPNYSNATFQATIYNSQGQATIKSNYFFEFKDGTWTVKDQGSSAPPISKFCQSPASPHNVVYVFLTQPDINNINFKFTDVSDSSDTWIAKYQKSYLIKYRNTLLPNVIHYDENIPSNGFDNIFGYDACRYALWVGAFLQTSSPNDTSLNLPKNVLQSLLNPLLNNEKTDVNPNFIKNNTLPSGGIDVLTFQPVGDWNTPAIPLNATVMVGSLILSEQVQTGQNFEIYKKIFEAISPSVLAYKIVDNQPSPSDPTGDSNPYYSAALVLISEAILNQRPPFQKQEAM